MPDETIAVNRRARHDYTIEDTLEAGIVLTGTEIKSVREHRVNIAEAYVRIDHGEAWLVGAHVAEYAQGNRYNHVPNRTRKLLLHRDQIAELTGLQSANGMTLVPLRLYLRRGRAKLEVGVARSPSAMCGASLSASRRRPAGSSSRTPVHHRGGRRLVESASNRFVGMS